MAHGGGGRLTRDLVRDIFVSHFDNPALNLLSDSALLDFSGGSIAFTTDTFVVQPHFFPGGDIGHLAVCGTVNDLAVSGAKPLALCAGFILEEGFPISDLKRIVESMEKTARLAGVNIVAGDTKVVEKGKADGIFINTSGIGLLSPGLFSDSPPAPGDAVIINGTLGDHGMAVMAAREQLPIQWDIKSDASPLNDMIFQTADAVPGKIRWMRDATRGGLATVLNELAQGNSFGVSLREDSIPIKEPVRAVCEMLGLDPLYVANEGVAVMVVSPDGEDITLKTLRSHPLGRNALTVGRITDSNPGMVVLDTFIGGGRVLDLLTGDQLPRIC